MPALHRIAFAALFIGGVASAQVVELSGGASTAYDAQGVSVHVRAASLDAQFGMGISGGRFAAGGNTVRSIRNGTATLGQQDLRADMPTDVFDTRHTLFGTGIGIRQEFDGHALVAFTGYTSLRSGTPLFQSVDLGKPLQFVRFNSRIGKHCGSALTAMSGAATLALAGVECSALRWLTWAATAGVGAGAPYAAGSAVLHWRDLDVKAAYIAASDHFQRGDASQQATPEPVRENVSANWRPSRAWKLSVAHGNWAMPSVTGGGSIDKSSMDSGGFAWDHHDLSVGATALRSHYQDGSNAETGGATAAFSGSVRYRTRNVEWSETLLHAKGSSGLRSTIVSTAVSVQPNARLRLSEAINVTGQGVTFSHGGALLTRFSTVDVDYQFYYEANRPDRPFQQGILFRADLQLPGQLKVSASSSISPAGTPQYTFQIGRVFARNHNERAASSNQMGKSVVRGHVQETEGSPVGRAALLIGGEHVYTDDAGNFIWRETRARTHPFRVLTEEFVAADSYVVVEAPVEVRSGDPAPLRIVVRRTAPSAQ